MKLMTLLLAAGLLVLAAKPSRSQTPTTRGRVVVIMGASTAAGTGATPISASWANRYAAYVKSLSPANRVYNVAAGGYTLYQMLPTGMNISKRWSPDPEHNITKALSYHPDAIILNMSTNDAASGIPLADIERNIRTLAETARQAGVMFWVSASPPRNLDAAGRKELKDLRDWVMDTFAAHALDFWTGLAAPDGGIVPELGAGDGIHLNNAGHAVLYQRAKAAPIVTR